MWIIEIVKALWHQVHAKNGPRHLRTDNIRSFRAEVSAFAQVKPQVTGHVDYWCGRPVYINGERKMIRY